MNQHFTGDEAQMTEIMKKYSTLLIKKMQIKMSGKYFMKPT